MLGKLSKRVTYSPAERKAIKRQTARRARRAARRGQVFIIKGYA